MKDYSNLRVASVQISYELEKKEDVFRVIYDDVYTRKILSILHYLKGKADVVVFPELSIPFEMLYTLKEYVSSSPMMIIAGSHYIENKDLVEHSSLFDHHFQEDKDTRKSICPVIIPNGTMFHIEKINPSKEEDIGFDEVGMTRGNIQSIFKVGDYNIGIMICSDFLNDDLRNRIKSKSHLLIVPQYNLRMRRFYEIAESEFSNPNNTLHGIFLSNANIKLESNSKDDSTNKERIGSAIFRNFSKRDQKLREQEYGYHHAALITGNEIKEDIVILTTINLKGNSERTPSVWSEDDHPVDYMLVPILGTKEKLSVFTKLLNESKDHESCVRVIQENRYLLEKASNLLFERTKSLENKKLHEIKYRFQMILV